MTSGFVATLLFAVPVSGQVPSAPLPLPDLNPEDLSQAAIAFVNIATAPGISGSNFRVRDPGVRRSDLVRSNLGFSAEFTLRQPVFNGYWGASLGVGNLEDELQLTLPTGQQAKISVDRDLVSLRGSGGLVFPLTEHFRVRPFLSLILGRLRSQAAVASLPETGPALPPEPAFDTTDYSYTVAGSVEAIYDRWFSRHRLELIGLYNSAYTEVFSADAEIFETSGWNGTVVLTSRVSAPLSLETAGRPWYYHAELNYRRFLRQEKISLGFNDYAEIAAGIDYEWNLKPLDWFGIRYVGFRVGYIFGQDLDGYSIGLSFR